MRKLLMGLAAAAVLVPGAAFASVDNVLFNNGTNGSVVAEAGNVIPMDILISSSGTDVDAVWVNFPGAGGSAEVGRCYDITPNQIGSSPAGGWTVHVELDRTPQNAGLWEMTVKTYGLDAVDAEDNQCYTGVDFSKSFTGNDRRVTITNSPSTGGGANNSGGSGNSSGNGGGVGGSGGSGNGGFNGMSFADLVAALKLALGIGGSGSTTPTATDAQCAAFTAANVGTQANVYNAGNIALQGYLLSQHMSIPALTQGGAAFGYYGNQTTAAVGQWRSMHPTCV